MGGGGSPKMWTGAGGQLGSKGHCHLLEGKHFPPARTSCFCEKEGKEPPLFRVFFPGSGLDPSNGRFPHSFGRHYYVKRPGPYQGVIQLHTKVLPGSQDQLVLEALVFGGLGLVVGDHQHRLKGQQKTEGQKGARLAGGGGGASPQSAWGSGAEHLLLAWDVDVNPQDSEQATLGQGGA